MTVNSSSSSNNNMSDANYLQLKQYLIATMAARLLRREQQRQ
jgi:hypothetical protein